MLGMLSLYLYIFNLISSYRTTFYTFGPDH